MRLPKGERADVPLSRLRTYLLNPQHPKGKHKARVFAAALGLDESSAEALRDWLLELARTGEAAPGRSDAHGARFAMTAKMSYNGHEALVRTAWIIRTGNDTPEFLTAFVE